MDEYLFFQQHKKQLKDSNSILQPKIFNQKFSDSSSTFEFNSTGSSAFSAAKAKINPLLSSISSTRENVRFPPIKTAQKKNVKDIENIPVTIDPTHTCCKGSELSCDTMHKCLKMLSGNYTEQYASSGFPPKICTLIMKELSMGRPNMLKQKILDLGCGKGHVGEYLRQDGYAHITGLDCSKNLLQIAESKKVYEKLEKVAIGETELGQAHMGKYDFVISSSMINNDGWDDKVFHQMLDLVKMGGFLIFATKLNLSKDNQYAQEMDKLSNEQYWKFITEHTFFRYDKICTERGKFSNKKVKIVAYQKTDHSIWVEQERIKAYEAEMIKAKKQSLIDEKVKKVEDKLNGSQIRQKERKMLQQKKSSMRVAEEQKAAEKVKIIEQEASKAAELMEIEKQKLMEVMKVKMKEAMWSKLKAAQAEEIARREAKRQEVQNKLNGPKKVKPGFNAGA